MNAMANLYLRRAVKAFSIAMVLKGAVGGSLAALALMGFSVPLLGVSPTPIGEGIVASAGAIFGVIVAFRA